MTKQTDRRTFLAAAGATAATVALAGCSSGDNGDGDNGDGDNGDGDNGDVSVPDEVDSYLSDALNYDGSAEDLREQDEITIDVGAGDSGLAFDPAAVVVTPGTEVEWAWTGQGGAHNVVSADSSDTEFDSGDTVDSDSETFYQTFDEPGNNMYYCNPHEGAGMLGAVIVQEA
ncbi:MAG: halocyanin-like protein [Natronomonas sp.]|jgi:halocyanin-like protein